jgi:hypothetical protein
MIRHATYAYDTFKQNETTTRTHTHTLAVFDQ